jgi:hypothetical protein
VLAVGKTVEAFDLHDSAIAAALRMGFDLIIDSISAGSVSEDRIKKFYVKEVDDLRERGGMAAVNIVSDAFNILSAVGLGSVDPLKVSQWFREEAERKWCSTASPRKDQRQADSNVPAWSYCVSTSATARSPRPDASFSMSWSRRAWCRAAA